MGVLPVDGDVFSHEVLAAVTTLAMSERHFIKIVYVVDIVVEGLVRALFLALEVYLNGGFASKLVFTARVHALEGLAYSVEKPAAARVCALVGCVQSRSL